MTHLRIAVITYDLECKSHTTVPTLAGLARVHYCTALLRATQCQSTNIADISAYLRRALGGPGPHETIALEMTINLLP